MKIHNLFIIIASGLIAGAALTTASVNYSAFPSIRISHEFGSEIPSNKGISPVLFAKQGGNNNSLKHVTANDEQRLARQEQKREDMEEQKAQRAQRQEQKRREQDEKNAQRRERQEQKRQDMEKKNSERFERQEQTRREHEGQQGNRPPQKLHK